MKTDTAMIVCPACNCKFNPETSQRTCPHASRDANRAIMQKAYDQILQRKQEGKPLTGDAIYEPTA